MDWSQEGIYSGAAVSQQQWLLTIQQSRTDCPTVSSLDKEHAWQPPDCVRNWEFLVRVGFLTSCFCCGWNTLRRLAGNKSFFTLECVSPMIVQLFFLVKLKNIFNQTRNSKNAFTILTILYSYQVFKRLLGNICSLLGSSLQITKPFC